MPLIALPTTFNSREERAAYVASLAPWLEDAAISPIEGGEQAAQRQLNAIKPLTYAKTRNHLQGDVSRLSPYIRHGLANLDTVRNLAIDKAGGNAKKIEKFIQELGWREFWQTVYANHPDWIWQSVEPYKTGYSESDYADTLPDDILRGETGVAVIDHFIRELHETGYVHNHARMYLAAYVVHFRRVKWQAGAQWFLTHLLDGDPASNNLSWQWIASTFSHKPYIFNLDNVRKYSDDTLDTSPEHNAPLNASYEDLNAQLFPNARHHD